MIDPRQDAAAANAWTKRFAEQPQVRRPDDHDATSAPGARADAALQLSLAGFRCVVAAGVFGVVYASLAWLGDYRVAGSDVDDLVRALTTRVLNPLDPDVELP